MRSVKPSDDSASSGRTLVATYGLKFADLDRFATFGEAVGRMVPVRVFPSEVRYLDRMANARLVGTTAEYADVNQLAPARGRFLTGEDDRNLSNVCVLGAGLADKLFPFEDAMGKTVMTRSNRFVVVGVCGDRMVHRGDRRQPVGRGLQPRPVRPVQHGPGPDRGDGVHSGRPGRGVGKRCRCRRSR